MPVYDPAILNLVRAGQKTAANDAIAQDHPTNFLEFTGSLAEYIDNFWFATSGSSNSIGTGTKAFTLAVGRGWPAGTPVYITEDDDPEANFMVGTLDSDETDDVISVTVTGATGSGTFTAWTIRVLHSATTVASPPLGIADGGTGASTAAGAVAALGISRTRRAVERANTPPGVPVTGAYYVVGPSGTGAWSGHNDEWAFYNGSSYAFEAPAEGDLAFIGTDSLYTGGGQGNDVAAVYFLASWSTVIRPRIATVALNTSGTVTLSATGLSRNPHHYRKSTTNTPTFTLPAEWGSGHPAAEGLPVIVTNAGTSGNVTVNVTGGGTIDGGASATVTPGTVKQFGWLSSGKWATL
jgi:hypothetical protein